MKSLLIAATLFASIASANAYCLEHEPSGNGNWRIGHVLNNDDNHDLSNRFYAGRKENLSPIWKPLTSSNVVKFQHCRDAELVLDNIGGWLYDNVGYEQYD